jgi:hypothetical protein
MSLYLSIVVAALAFACAALAADRGKGAAMVRLRVLASISIAYGVVTGVAGPDFGYMRAPASREGVCRTLLEAERSVRAGVHNARVVDSAGNELVTCE